MNKLHWSIDSFVQSNRTIFSYGWLFHQEKEIKRLQFTFSGDDKPGIEADYGKARKDVGDYFSIYKSAYYSGFIVYGSMGEQSENASLNLTCYYEDGTTESVELPQNVINPVNESDMSTPKVTGTVVFKQFYVLFKRAMLLLRTGNFSLLYEKFKRYRRNLTLKKLDAPREITNFITESEAASVVFFLDHDLGGGANHYRDRMIEQKLEKGQASLVLAFNINLLSYKLIIVSSKGRQSFNIPGYDFVYQLLNCIKIEQIFYNTGVSFYNPETIPDFLIQLKIKSGAKLTTLAHDLFPLCPSHFLINNEGVYCDIPDAKVCTHCLRHNTFGFTTLFESGNINEWRDRWGNLLIASESIVAFSESTLNLYKRVYPQIRPESTHVLPHAVDYIPEKVTVTQTQRLKIGVVGQIGHHKGAKILQNLAHEIHDKNYPADIIVVGSVEASCPADVVVQTGPYKQADLKSLLESYGVNIILFPSIWPETFSYVVQEMIELNLPIAGFNLGAPAERLRNYDKGLILSSMESDTILQELIDFHQKIYAI